MKFLVLTEAGAKKGFGHLARCIALKSAIDNIDPDGEVCFIVNGDGKAEDFARSEGVDNVSFFDWTINFERVLEDLKKEDIIIIDSYLAEKNIYNELSDKVNGKIVMLDDYSRIGYPAGIVVNPAVYVDKTKYKKNSKIKYLFGAEYAILRREFWAFPEKTIRAKPKKILFALGSSEAGKDLAKRLMEIQSKRDFVLKSAVTDGKMVSAEEMSVLMMDADICISGGGQILNELARVGLPSVAVGIADNQKYNLKGFKERGFIKHAGWITDPDLDIRITRCLDLLSFYEERKKRSSAGRALVDGRGSIRIIEQVIDCFNSR